MTLFIFSCITSFNCLLCGPFTGAVVSEGSLNLSCGSSLACSRIGRLACLGGEVGSHD